MWYHINYDIIDGTDDDYEVLFEEIMKCPAYAHVLKSGWVVKSNEKANVIRDRLQNAVSANLHVLVTSMQGNDAAVLENSDINYLVKNLGWKSP